MDDEDLPANARERGALKIVSADDESWLRIARYDDEEGCPGWAVEASLRVPGSRFHGRNGGVYFHDLDGFIAALDAFILDRSKAVELEGTYDCSLRFRGDATGVRLEFTVGDAGAFGQRYAVSGVFSIAQDTLLHLLTEFRALGAV